MKRLFACLLVCLSVGFCFAKTEYFSMKIKETSLGNDRYVKKIIANYQMSEKFKNETSTIFSNERNDFIEIDTFDNFLAKIEVVNVCINKELKSRTTITVKYRDGVTLDGSFYENSTCLKSGGSDGSWELNSLGATQYFLAGVYVRALTRGKHNDLNFPENIVDKDIKIINTFKDDEVKHWMDIFTKSERTLDYLYSKIENIIDR